MGNKELLTQMAQATRLREGSEGVRAFLQVVFQNEGISTKGCARAVRLPLPLAAALKKEAIRAGLLHEGPKMRLTVEGLSYCQDILGFTHTQSYTCQRCRGLKIAIPVEMEALLEQIEMYLKFRPQVDVTIDQSMCTPQTALRRALLALDKGVLFQDAIAFMGDDDLISVTIALLLKHLKIERSWPRLTVFDIDTRFLDYIDNIAEELNLAIETVHHDFRKPMPSVYHNKFTTFFTDPPYTTEGCHLFIDRGVSLLKEGAGFFAFLSYAHKAPLEMLTVQRNLLQSGLVIDEILPGFNHYVGAEMIANQGQMLVLQSTQQTQAKLTGQFQQQMYTGVQRQTNRVYRCKQCGEVFTVGQGQSFQTIEALKEQGCLKCGQKQFERQSRATFGDTH